MRGRKNNDDIEDTGGTLNSFSYAVPRSKRVAGPRGRYLSRKSSINASYRSRRINEAQENTTFEDSCRIVHAQQNDSGVNDDNVQTSQDNTTLATDEGQELQLLRHSLKSLRDERDKLLEQFNELKVKYDDLDRQLLSAGVVRKSLEFQVGSLQGELASLKVTLQSIEKHNEDLTLRLANTPKGTRFRARLDKNLDRKYIAFALALEKEITKWSANQTMELKDKDANSIERDWEGRMEVVSSIGIKIEGFQSEIVPTPFENIVSCTVPFYIKTFSSHSEVLENLIKKLLQSSDWDYLSNNDESKNEIISLLSTHDTLLSRFRQCLSDNISLRKKDSKDELFRLLHFTKLTSTPDRFQNISNTSKSYQVKTAKLKLLKITSSGVIDYSWWRKAGKEELQIPCTDASLVADSHSEEEPIWDVPLPLEGNNHQCGKSLMGVLCNTVSLPVYHIFLGYNPKDETNACVSNTFLSISRLDAWIATVVQLLVEKESRGGGRQKIYNDTFMNHYNASVQQFIGETRKFVQYWAPHELELPTAELPTASTVQMKEAFLSMERDVTVIVHSRKYETTYISVKHSWFSQFITPLLGEIHDCYIARIRNDWTSIELLGQTLEESIACRTNITHTLSENDSQNDLLDSLGDKVPSGDTVPPLPLN